MIDYLVQIDDVVRRATPEEVAVIEAEQSIPSIITTQNEQTDIGDVT